MSVSYHKVNITQDVWGNYNVKVKWLLFWITVRSTKKRDEALNEASTLMSRLL